MAQHPPRTGIGIDDANQHAQGCRLARAIGTENSVNRTFGHGEVDPVDRKRAFETLDEPARINRERARHIVRRLQLA